MEARVRGAGRRSRPAGPDSGCRGPGCWLGLAALLLIGCSDAQTSTQPGILPAQLVALSPAADTVEMGGALQEPLSVRVVTASGEPVEGIPVRFLLLNGPGTVFPNLAVSDEEGVAEALFEAGGAAESSRVRADIPSAGNVEAIFFDILTVPSAFVELTAADGNSQVAEVESQLPLPFVVNAIVGEGIPATGIAIAWEVESELSGLRLSADTTFTDEEGRSEALLTLGPETGNVVVSAFATRTTASDTVRFTATARDVLETGVLIDFVEPLPLQAGEPATLFGGGFSASLDDNEIRIEGVQAEIISASPTEVSFVVPSFLDRCLPEREVGVRVLVRGEASNGQLVSLLPTQTPVSLSVGQTALLRGEEALCVQLAGSEQRADFVFHVQSTSRVHDAVATIRMGLHTAEETDFASAERIAADAALVDQFGERAGEALIASNAIEELLHLEARPLRASGVPGPRASLRPTSMAVGDTLQVQFAVRANLSISCTSPAPVIDGVVRAIGDRVVFLEDALAPTAGFGEADWALLRDEFDQAVYPTDAAFFGEVADIDGNDRVIVLFTPEVNRLSPPGGGRVNGFFLPLDLAASGRPGGGGVPGPDGLVCATSNEGEILYIGVADPEGEFGSPFTPAQAMRAGRRAVAHELQHLINAEQRVVLASGDFTTIEETWLDEGLSHLAQDLVGLGLMGLAEAQNITFDLIAGDRDRLDLFNIYHIPSFFSLGLYMIAPGIAPVLSPFNPGGGSEHMRGFAYSFLRYLLDQHGGDDPASFLRTIVSGGSGQRRGIANVESVVSRSWENLIADFAMALAVDNTDVAGLEDRFKFRTWNLRDIFGQLNENPAAGRRFPLPYPLAVFPLSLQTAAFDFDLFASTEAFFSLRGRPDAPAIAIELFGQDGAALPSTASPQLLILRTR